MATRSTSRPTCATSRCDPGEVGRFAPRRGLSVPRGSVARVIDNVHVVAYGRPAGEALAPVIAGVQAGSRLAPVTVVVPSNFAGLAARRLLGSGRLGGPGIANVGFLTPFRFAELVAGDQLLDRRPLTNPVLGAAVRRALAEHTGPFASVAHHHATETAIAELYAELSNVDPVGRRAVASAGGVVAAGVALVEAIDGLLAGYHGEADVARAAASRRDLARALAPFGHVVWYLPAPTTAPLAGFLAAAFATAPSTVVVAETGHAEADAAVWASCARAGVARPADAAVVGPPTGEVIVSVTDADDEVRAVVRRIAALVEQGVALDRIGIFHPTPDPYVRLLEHHLAAAGIPANGPSRRPLRDSVAGRTLLDALALPERRWRRDQVMALVADAPVRHGDGLAPAAAWELRTREIGVVQDLTDWTRKVHGRLAALDRKAEGEVSAGRAAAIERERDDLTGLAAFIDELAAAVDAVDSAGTWADKTAAAKVLLVRLLGPGHRHTSWPEIEREAFDRVDDALSRLASLDDIDPTPTSRTFVRALTAELEVARSRTGRFGDGVTYGPVGASVGHDLDAVFVLGCTEGLLPAPRRDEALLPDAARARAGGQLELRADRLHHQHRALLAALAAAPAERRVLTFPRGDLRSGREAVPSRWLLDTASARAGRTVHATDFAALGAPVVDHVDSHLAGLVRAEVHGTLVDRDLAAVLAHARAGDDPAAHPVASLVARGLQAQRARRSDAFTEWDGNLAGQPITVSGDEPMSATRFETWSKCGFRYLLGHVLGLADRDEPERILELDALDRGSAVHLVLERFTQEMIDRGPPAPHQPWSAAQRERLFAIAAEVFDELEARGRTGRPLHWELTRADLVALFDAFLDRDDRHRAGFGTTPIAAEMAFGMRGAPPLRITLDDGRVLTFRGSADRVDRTHDGEVVVLDYKTGRPGYDILATDPVAAGTLLQLGLYAEVAIAALGAPSATAAYWTVNTRYPCEPAGYRWTPDRRERFFAVLAHIADGIEGGSFAARPGDWSIFRNAHDNCVYCEFNEVCVRDRGEHAEVKITARRAHDALVLVPDADHGSSDDRSPTEVDR